MCLSYVFNVSSLWLECIDSAQEYGHKEDGIRRFCSHQPSTGRHLRTCLFSIEMSGNHPPYKSFIFLLFTCSLSFFPHLFEKSSVTWGDVELHHLSRRIKFYSLTFSLWSSICEAIFFKLFDNLAMENHIQCYFFFWSLISVSERNYFCDCWYSMTGTLFFRKRVSVCSKLSEV